MHCPSSSPRNHPILEFGGLPWLLESAAKYLRSSGVVMTLKEGVSEKDGILSGGGGGRLTFQDADRTRYDTRGHIVAISQN